MSLSHVRIVGSGLIGSSLGLALVQEGVAVTMVELRLVSLCAASRDRYRALSKLKAEVEAGSCTYNRTSPPSKPSG